MKNTMTGNRALFKVDGKIVGEGIQNVNFQNDHGLQKVSGIGSALPKEHVVGEVNYTISLSSFFIYNKQLSEQGIVPDEKNLLTSGTLDIELIDNITGHLLHHYSGCKVASYSSSYAKHGISGQDATFQATNRIK
jgi:hypothetical protein